MCSFINSITETVLYGLPSKSEHPKEPKVPNSQQNVEEIEIFFAGKQTESCCKLCYQAVT